MKLWFSPTSPYARKVRIVLREKGIVCEEVSPANVYAAVTDKNPLGKVPVLELGDGTVLYDSVVIVEYLDALEDEPRLIPRAPLERALVRRFEALADGIADAVVLAMVEQRRAAGMLDASVVAKQHGKVCAGLGAIAAALGQGVLPADGTFSLADAALLSALGYIGLRAPELVEGIPSIVRDYQARFATRPSVAATAPPA